MFNLSLKRQQFATSEIERFLSKHVSPSKMSVKSRILGTFLMARKQVENF